MSVTAVIGTQWGDEGKGRLVDYLALEADFVVRFSGGNNAGHTIVNEYGEFSLHLVPAGICHPHPTCVIGNGVVVDPRSLIAEIEELARRGIDVGSRLKVSGRTHAVMPWHRLLDAAEEAARGAQKLGTTRRGIGPAFVDKVGRTGIRLEDACDPGSFRTYIRETYGVKVKVLKGVYGCGELASEEEIFREYQAYFERIARYVCRTEPILWGAVADGKRVLLEGAQGAGLDIDFGTYPYVTSAPAGTGVAAAAQGSGIPPAKISRVIGVVKAYATRVGEGPFPTEMPEGLARIIRARKRGNEYGATTGRPRRCGWLDLVALGDVVRTQGVTELALTKLDVLSSLEKIRVRTNTGVLSYIELSGWEEHLDRCKTYCDLPANARSYVRFIEETLEVPVSFISVGKMRDAMIVRI